MTRRWLFRLFGGALVGSRLGRLLKGRPASDGAQAGGGVWQPHVPANGLQATGAPGLPMVGSGYGQRKLRAAQEKINVCRTHPQ